MKMHKTAVLFCLWGALFLGVSSSAAFVAHTVAAYSGACEKLDGLPGMLQSAGFIPRGDCKLVHGDCPGPKNEYCEVGGKLGHCIKDVIDGKHVCVCVRDRVSR
jgi:hypothetical protein